METILIVEDHKEFRGIIDMILVDAGYKTILAENGKDASEKLRAGLRPNLILSDIRMPGFSGLELSMMAAKEFPTIPILLMSGLVDIKETHLKSLNAKHLIKKPFTAEELKTAIVTCLTP